MLAYVISALNDDDKDFITRLVDEYGDRMYSKAMSILKNESDAEDAVQETFLKIIKYIDKFNRNTDNRDKMLSIISFGLMASIKNTSLTLYGKNKKRESKETSLFYEIDEDEHTAEPEDTTENVEDIVISREEYQLLKKLCYSSRRICSQLCIWFIRMNLHMMKRLIFSEYHFQRSKTGYTAQR